MLGYRELDFSSSVGAAGYLQARSDLVSTFAHSRQTPVAIASRVNELRIYTLSVIAEEKSQAGWLVCKFDFYQIRCRMTEGISERLSSDSINFVTDRRIQSSSPTF